MQAMHLQGFPALGLAAFLMKTLKINSVNRLYADNHQKRSLEFLDSVLDELEVKYQLNEYELNKLPSTGPFIMISNHPFGIIEDLLLIKIITKRRPDFKVLGSSLLQRVEPLQDFMFTVNPDAKRVSKNSVKTESFKEAQKHLIENHPIAIFPAADISSLNGRITVQDKPWKKARLKFIKQAEVPVIPTYFHGSNSALFHALGIINPQFRVAKLPSELFNKRKKSLIIRIGSPISVKEQHEFKDIARYGRFLRAKTYALGSAIEVHKFFHKKVKKREKKEEIISRIEPCNFMEEIEKLPDQHHLFRSNNFQVICAPSHLIPHCLNEIGRLREVTFREVGEGTNRSIDLDEYDLYYEHLFVWDQAQKKIVGAYRMGKGREIIDRYGKKGFYINSLFKIKKGLLPVLQMSVELGRSFVVKEYQRKPIPLFLLWKGILCVLLKNPQYRYLIGPVSISNNFSEFSKSLMVDFIQSNHFHQEYAKMVKPKKKFKLKYRHVDYQIMLDSTGGNINKLDKLIEEIELNHFKMPVLIKKYLKQNARILGFSVDPMFNKTLDGLMILDLFDLPINTITSLSKELDDNSIMQRFSSLQSKRF